MMIRYTLLGYSYLRLKLEQADLKYASTQN